MPLIEDLKMNLMMSFTKKKQKNEYNYQKNIQK